MEGDGSGTSMPLQTGCLSVCLRASHDPHLGPRASLSNPQILRKNKPKRSKRSVMGSAAHLWASLNREPGGSGRSGPRPRQAAGGIGCISLIKVVGGRGALVRSQCQMKERSEGGSVSALSRGQQKTKQDKSGSNRKKSFSAK